MQPSYPSNMILVDHNGIPVNPWPGGFMPMDYQIPAPLPSADMVIVQEEVIPIAGQAKDMGNTIKNVVEKIAKPKAIAKPKIDKELKSSETNPDLQCLFDCMVSMCAWLNELRTQSHLIHLNYTGSNFISIHKFLKDQYEDHQEQFDAVGELLRSMGGKLPMCSVGLQESICGCFENCTSYSGVDMLMSYVKNLEAMGMRAKDLEQLAGCNRAIDVQNYAAELVGAAFKASWFIKASCGCEM